MVIYDTFTLNNNVLYEYFSSLFALDAFLCDELTFLYFSRESFSPDTLFLFLHFGNCSSLEVISDLQIGMELTLLITISSGSCFVFLKINLIY